MTSLGVAFVDGTVACTGSGESGSGWDASIGVIGAVLDGTVVVGMRELVEIGSMAAVDASGRVLGVGREEVAEWDSGSSRRVLGLGGEEVAGWESIEICKRTFLALMGAETRISG